MKPSCLSYCKDCKYWMQGNVYKLGKCRWCCVRDKFTGANYYCNYSKPKKEI